MERTKKHKIVEQRYTLDTLHLQKSLNHLKAFAPELQRIEAMMRKWCKSRKLEAAGL